MSTPALSNSLKKTGYKAINLPTRTDVGQQMAQTLRGGLEPGVSPALGQLSSLAGGGTPEMWEQLEAPAWRDYQKGLGDIGARFSMLAPGAQSAQRSSGFGHALGGQAGELAERLMSNRMGLQQRAQRDLLSLYMELIGQEKPETALIPKKKPFWQELLSGLSGGIGQGIGMLPMLAML